MKNFFGIFIILSTFAIPAISFEHENSSSYIQRTFDFCDSEGYVERTRVSSMYPYSYFHSLGTYSENCDATPASVTISCYKYKKIDNIEEKITQEFSNSCDGKKVNVIINKNLTRPASHLSQAKLCDITNGEWENNKCTCNPRKGTYYKYDKLSGCSIIDESRTKKEAKKAEQKAKAEEKEAKKTEQKAKKEQQKKEKEAAKKQLASDCATAGGEIKAGKCKCNDNKKIYDPKTIKCISKTANYNAAVDILKQINSALDETMTKLSKKNTGRKINEN